MGAQRADNLRDDQYDAEQAIAEVRRIQAEIQARNPDMTQDDWDRLADEWAEDVNQTIREMVIRQREEAAAHHP